MAEPSSYEGQRTRQVEENKRKLEELRLHRLSAAVRDAAVKPMPAKERKLPYARPPPGPTRRSGRVASLPKQPDYRDIHALRATYVERELPPDRVYVTDEARAYAFTKAEELKNQLYSDHPSFIKSMTHLYATRTGLVIPLQFKRYLPPHDEMVFLVDEEGGEFQILYPARQRCRFGDGWKSFTINHTLADGDCLVFQLVQRTKFKIQLDHTEAKKIRLRFQFGKKIRERIILSHTIFRYAASGMV